MSISQKVLPCYIGEKAGMASVNAETIAKRIAQITSGTPKDLHERQLQKKRALEVTSMLQKTMKYKKEDREQIKIRWNKKIEQFQQDRQLDKYWAHLDFDMFYVACELLDKSEYKDLPCAVGGENSVLCTANYAARLYGVRSAMPTFIAKKICPQLILFKPNFEKYRRYSDIFRDTLRKFDENLESMGLDEAYVDLTPYLKGKSLQQQSKFIQDIRKDIFNKTNLTVSCGIGANKLLAKMGSEINKPNGQYIVQNKSEVIMNFMRDKKIRKIHGIGPVNEYYLKGLGIQTAKDILQNLDVLAICFSQNSCQYFVQSAMGIGHNEHQFKQRKSVGKTQTFKACCDKEFLQAKLLELCEQVQHELEELGFVSINVVFQYKTENFDKKDKTFNLDKYTSEKKDFYDAIIGYLRESIIEKGNNVRLIGVKCSSLMKADEWKRKNLQNYFSRVRQREREKKKINKSQDEVKTEKNRPVQSEKPPSKQSQLLSEIKQKSQFICPICNQEVQCMNNLSAFNRHIDKCLKSAK